ncbi:flavin oxidoreductase [Kosmotoga arenicorallina S304]|uniref:Flavin oxidoreductase n=1 Tax=Kosmotoga arenicorallina S304 TaxID=1453497 RepID=A0A176K0S1_9BACT|nr:flavin reductase family protein [Kosmotoga arenicorallina]OAA30397.1 flavin oxidoreductase [Kosmotoga arenicorallina S304]
MDALGKIYSTTTIVTMNAKEKANGIAIAWITRVSINPPMIAISVGKTRYSHTLLNETDRFGVCIMRPEAEKLVNFFGSKSGRDIDKFAELDYEKSPSGIPIVPGTLAYIECTIKEKADAGDHTIFIGEVVLQKLFGNDKPLLYGEHSMLNPWLRD